jgi:hypothetical protein
MTRRSAAPFHQLSEVAVNARAWTHELNGGDGGAIRVILPDWDYGAFLRLERLVGVDWTRAATDLGFADAFDLELIVETGTGPGAIAREVVDVERVQLPYGCGPQMVTVSAPSGLLSHQLVLRSSIVLAAPGRAADVLSPHAPGLRLWADRQVTRLEGDEPRFPMEVVDFAKHFAGRPQYNAPWFVGWSVSGAHRDFRGAFRLYLNSNQPDVVQRIQDQDPVVLQAMLSDVVSQVCEGLLREEHGAAFDDADDGSLADQARHWLERAFGDVASARSVMEQRPAEFRAAILASVRL